MNSADGWGTTTDITIEFSGKSLLPETSDDLVKVDDADIFKMVKVTGPPTLTAPVFEKELKLGEDFTVWIKNRDLLVVKLLKPLLPNSQYMFAVSNQLKDINNKAIGMTQSYALVKSQLSVPLESDTLRQIQTRVHLTEKMLARQNVISVENIVYSSWFTTQSVGTISARTKLAISAGIASGDFSAIWKDGANPNSLNLSDAYKVNPPTSADPYEISLQNSAAFSKYIDNEANDNRTALLSAYNSLTTTTPGTEISVAKGHVSLPYFLEKAESSWNKTTFESAMPSIAIVSSLLNGSDSLQKAFIAKQLVEKGIDPTKLSDPQEAFKLVGIELSKLDSSKVDSARQMSQYSFIPKLKSLETLNFILFKATTPIPNVPMQLVIYQHGITSAKENAYAFAPMLINTAKATGKNLLLIAIDQPLHGERSLSSTYGSTTSTSPTAFLNLEYLMVARDNLRQSILDTVGLRAALSYSNALGALQGTILEGVLDNTAPAFVGHSLGGITGMSAVSVANQSVGDTQVDNLFTFSRAGIANSGGNIANLILTSDFFGPFVKHTLASAQSPDYVNFANANVATCQNKPNPAVCLFNLFETSASVDGSPLAPLLKGLNTAFDQFTFATQTVLDSIDPINMIQLKNADGTPVLSNLPILMQQVKGDDTVPNSSYPAAPLAGTTPMAALMSLITVDSQTIAEGEMKVVPGSKLFVKFNSGGKHSSFIAPSSDENFQVPNTAIPNDYLHTIEMQAQMGQFLGGNNNIQIKNNNKVSEALPVVPVLE
ncbi:lipase [Veronia nyctiphanis]|uniref:Lipase n=1 Tax=Veronia nyctiphanis TaxID=1278244 RepID=A0A4Q0YX28_9GAMM|nr:VolA/Pla-1 family phospholipase [Veronia nyctiphanis]RXJ73611.1 lipase [Veronia nyctiphanis]